MKKTLLAVVLALPFMANAQSPGGVEQSPGVKPAIWLKSDLGVTPTTDNTAITGWANSGSIPFTLVPLAGGTAPTYLFGEKAVNFGAGAALVFKQTGTELSSVLGDGTVGKKYEVFIVAAGKDNGSAPYFYLGGNTPTMSADATPILNHLNFGQRAVFFNNNTSQNGEGDGEVGYYGNESGAYTPNMVGDARPTDVIITNIMSHPNDGYTNLNSLVFSVNGFGATKQTDGITPTGSGSNAYWGKEQSYAVNSNAIYNINAQQILLGGKLNYTGTGLITSGTTRQKQGKYLEIIVYNRKLTVAERQKVYSYLALKYHIYLTHDQGAYTATAPAIGTSVGNGETVNNGTYFASDGTIFFKRDAANFTDTKDYRDGALANSATSFVKDTFYPLNGSGTNNAFSFFGRDDQSSFLRINGTTGIGVYFEVSPKFTVTLNADKQFMVATHNNQATTYTTNEAEAPFPSAAGVTGRLKRTWKIVSTNYSNGFTFNGGYLGQFPGAATTNPSTNVVLLVSKDPTFPANKTATVAVNAAATPWLDAKPNLTTLFGTASATQQFTFYVTYASTNGAPTLATTLPVEITSFTAKTNGSEVNVNWSTASEKNASHFEVTRSFDATNFVTIGKVYAAGNSSAKKSYSFVDKNPGVGFNYYQLKQVDNDGTPNFTGVISAKVSLSAAELIVKESTSDKITLTLKGSTANSATATAVNSLGQTIAKETIDLKNSNTFTLNTGATKGLIIVTVKTTEGTLSKKVIK